jgi:hypothetical protein
LLSDLIFFLMQKYLSIVTGDGTELIPIGDGLYVNQTSATVLALVSSNGVQYDLTTVAGTFALVNAINAALTEASQTNWRDTIHPVALPSGETVASITASAVA